MTRRQRVRTFIYFTIVILTSALGSVFWSSNGSSTASAAAHAKDSLWQELTPDSLDVLKHGKQSRGAPQRYKAFQLNEAALADLLAATPLESTVAAKDSQSEITLPMPDGTLARFRFVESPIMEPALAAQFPEIKTYQGWGIDDTTATTRFSSTSGGFHAIVLSTQATYYVEPLSQGETRIYASYYTQDAGGGDGAACLGSPSGRVPSRSNSHATLKSAPRDNRLALQSANNTTGTTRRTFRLAVAATAEYTNSVGGTVTSAMSAITTTISGVNAIFERELAVSFSLVNNNASIIFTDPATDEYTSGNLDLLPDENQTKLDQRVGESNYDIGHVFDHSASAEGVAPGLACNDGEKGKGVSNKQAALNFVRTVAHEIGHQFGAQHTFNGEPASNRYDATAYEPGRGKTLMTYGLSRIDYFHGTSLQLMADYLDNCGCGATTNNNNTPPNITVPTPTSFDPFGAFAYIPARTPFTLMASGSDANNDVLTFSWDQIDNGSPGSYGSDLGDNPLFDSKVPTRESFRTFPDWSDLLVVWRTPLMPTTGRYFHFLATARDNRGGFAQGEVVVGVMGDRGPFVVTQPTWGAQVTEGNSMNVTWDVAGTASAPISAQNMRILLSTDNGASFPIVLAASTLNTGSFIFTVPHANTQEARIKVEAIDNIFFDISDMFTINTRPAITTTGSPTVTQGGPSVTAQVATVADERDVPGSLAVTATTPAPSGVTLSVANNNGVVSATATAQCSAYAGTYSIQLRVTNSAGLSATTAFNVRVDPNPAPTLGNYPNSGVTVGGSVLIVPNAPPSDPNNAVRLSVNPATLPGGGQLTINLVNGYVTVNTVSSTALGVYPVEVTVKDDCGTVVTRSFNLTVRSATCATEQRMIFVADTGNHRIQRFDGVYWKVIGPGTKGSGLGQFMSPESVVASPDGRKIYVADTSNGRIQWSQDSGGTWAVFASSLVPQGLALDRDGNFYVSDAGNKRVVRYTSGVPGTPVVLATNGSGAGQVSNPNGLAIDCRMNLYIADTGNNRILVIATADAAVLSNTGTVVAAPGTGLNPAQVTKPQGVAVDNAGYLYVADTGNNRVLQIKSAPASGAAAVLCTFGSALGQVSGPEGVTIAAFATGPLAGWSSIVVSDTSNNRIQASAGSWMKLGSGPSAGTGSFTLPSKLR